MCKRFRSLRKGRIKAPTSIPVAFSIFSSSAICKDSLSFFPFLTAIELRYRGPTSDSDPGILAFSLIFGRLVAPLILLLSTVTENCINCSALLSVAFSVIIAEIVCVKAEKITRFSNCKIAFQRFDFSSFHGKII